MKPKQLNPLNHTARYKLTKKPALLFDSNGKFHPSIQHSMIGARNRSSKMSFLRFIYSISNVSITHYIPGTRTTLKTWLGTKRDKTAAFIEITVFWITAAANGTQLKAQLWLYHTYCITYSQKCQNLDVTVLRRNLLSRKVNGCKQTMSYNNTK